MYITVLKISTYDSLLPLDSFSTPSVSILFLRGYGVVCKSYLACVYFAVQVAGTDHSGSDEAPIDGG